MSRIAAALAALALVTVGIVTAQATPAASSPPAQVAATPGQSAELSAPPDLTAQDLGVFFKGLVPYALARDDLAGSVVVVVKDGKILFANGYGYADVAKRKLVIPDQTLFRPGSVSKLFTWTAVMQLVQEGKIDLDRDVNDYLDFKIPEKFGKPITMRNLMTHTAGFEEGISKEFVKNQSELFPLRDYLMQHMPARIYPPGKITAYSNYGCSLAGYIVQRLSGEPFAEYVAHHIFSPLGMTHSTFVQPLPASLAPDMASGYRLATDPKAQPFEYVETAPAGASSATGTDMAHFMIAHLNGGSYNGVSILNPATVALMHSPQSQMAPGLNGFDLGFYQENRNGLRIIGHGGDTGYFHSDLHLLLDKGVGFFIAFNSAGSDGAAEKVRMALFRAFLDRYFPYTPPEERTVFNPQRDAARVAGWYDSSRRIDSTLRLLSAVTQSEVRAQPDGTIEIDALKALNITGTVKHWREVGPLTYREVGGQTHTTFVTDASGEISYFISDDFLPVLVFQRVQGLKQFSYLKIMAGGAIAVLLLTVAIWFGGWIARRRFKTKLELPVQAARLRLASRIGALLILAMFGGWIAIFAALDSSSMSAELAVLYVVSLLALLGAATIIVEVVSRIFRGPGGWLVRASEFVLGVSALYTIWMIFEYGLANFNFTY